MLERLRLITKCWGDLGGLKIFEIGLFLKRIK
jgi:hypothetical protein